jgi:tetratricopeptide (TPR) repeat protein
MAIRAVFVFSVWLAVLTTGSAWAGAPEDVAAGMKAHQGGDMEEAIKLFTQAIDSGDLSPSQLASTYINRGLSFFKKRDYEWAIADYDAAIRLDPKNAAAYNNRGNAHNELGHKKQALDDYTEAIRRAPRFALAYNNRGNLLQKLGMFDKAVVDFDKAISFEPRFPLPYFNRANSHNMRGLFDLAIADYNVAIRLEPRFSLAYAGRGNAYSRKGLFDQAIADLDAAIRFRPYDRVPLTIRGHVKFLQGDFAGAETDYRLALKIGEPTFDAMVWLHMAWQRMGKGMPREFRIYARKTDLEVWPGAIVKFFNERMTEEEVLKEAEAGPEATRVDRQCEAWFYLGEHHLIAGDEAKAKDYFRKAVNTRRVTLREYVAARTELARLGSSG